MITADQLGVTLCEGRTQSESEHQDQDYDWQPAVGNQVILLLGWTAWSVVGRYSRCLQDRQRLLLDHRMRTMPASVQKAMFECPVLGQVIPAVVFQFPAIMPQPT